MSTDELIAFLTAAFNQGTNIKILFHKGTCEYAEVIGTVVLAPTLLPGPDTNPGTYKGFRLKSSSFPCPLEIPVDLGIIQEVIFA